MKIVLITVVFAAAAYVGLSIMISRRRRRREWDLVTAALMGDEARVAALLDTGVNPNATDTLGFTPLHRAVYPFGRKAVVDRLLVAGADVKACETNGMTPLEWAVEKDNADIVSALLQAGADPAVRDRRDRSTPLHRAARRGNARVVETLLCHQIGVNPEAKDKDGHTPFDLAIQNNHADVAALLQVASAPDPAPRGK